MAVSIGKTKLGFLVATLLSISFAQAQEKKELPKFPGDIIKLEAKFDGPYADKITAIYPSLNNTKGERAPDQAGFVNGIGGQVTKTGPGTYMMVFTVEQTTNPGDYTLAMDVRAGSIQLSYSDGRQFTLHPFHIENKNKFEQPPVTIKELP